MSFAIPAASKGLVINYGEGAGLHNGKIAGPKLFAPPQVRVKPFVPPPPSIWLKLQATA